MSSNINPTGPGVIEPIPSGDDPLVLPLHLLDRLSGNLDKDAQYMRSAGEERIRQLEEKAVGLRAEMERQIAELAAEAERVRAGVEEDVARTLAFGVEVARRAQAAGVRL